MGARHRERAAANLRVGTNGWQQAAPVWRTASVAAPSAIRATTFATAAIVLGPAAGAMLRSAGHPVRLVHADGGVTLLNGWPAEQRAA